jgi:D,D-heptose 1,7-bisphosphate phosphatase
LSRLGLDNLKANGGVARAAVFLDRDGTLNVERGPLSRPEDIELLPGVGRALRDMKQAGFLLIVVTNQSIIARGHASRAQVDAVNRRLALELGAAGASLDAIYVCPHHPTPGADRARAGLAIECECRKPAPGLVRQACRDFPIDLSRSWMIGDHTRDIEMAQRAGLRSVLVKTGHAGADGEWAITPDHAVEGLAEAAAFIVGEIHAADSAFR